MILRDVRVDTLSTIFVVMCLIIYKKEHLNLYVRIDKKKHLKAGIGGHFPCITIIYNNYKAYLFFI